MIIGHKKILNLFEKAASKNQLGQAYLFCGPSGVGKKFLALWLFDKYFSRKEKKVILIEPAMEEKKGIVKKKEIGIEKIRELRHEASLSLGAGGKRFFLIDEAERMSVAAQNSLLKVLEEPPQDSIFILVSGEEKRILPTIASRCQKINFGLVSNEEIGKIIPSDISNKEAIVFWSLGRPGEAFRLMQDENEMEFRKKALNHFKILFGKDINQKFILAEELSKNQTVAIFELEIFLVLLRSSLLDLGKIKLPQEKSFRLIEKIASGIETIKNTNANCRLVLENIFLDF